MKLGDDPQPLTRFQLMFYSSFYIRRKNKKHHKSGWQFL